MEKKKVGRTKLPDNLKAHNRTIRMTDEIFQWFKELGGTKYLVMMVRRDKDKL